ncbi:MAG TPA: hypothetical protein VNR87_09515 [Flavisolibacter sp.]|nr:hypothetical protein [Flavisolibacter sp.]
MKNLFLLFLVVSTLTAPAQKIGGFYSGTLFNDSTKMVQKYELAISEYRGKFSGYSYVTFIANDTFYYGIRKIRASVVGDSLIVEDDKMIVNNFPEPPAKGVGRVITIPLKGQDSVVVLNGRWKTNQTKKYYSVPGAIDLNRSDDSTHSPLIAHLKELNIIPSTPYQQTGDVAIAPPKPKESETKRDETSIVESKVKTKDVAKDPAKETVTKTKTKVKADPVNEAKKAEPPVATAPAVLSYDQRSNRITETVEVVADSLSLAFYDNGVVDGDSISVYLNGQNIISKARLMSSATKKSVSIAGMSEITLLLVAENLGSIPPNTGLLSIRDGVNVYQVNFSADMQTNATIVIRRKIK